MPYLGAPGDGETETSDPEPDGPVQVEEPSVQNPSPGTVDPDPTAPNNGGVEPDTPSGVVNDNPSSTDEFNGNAPGGGYQPGEGGHTDAPDTGSPTVDPDGGGPSAEDPSVQDGAAEDVNPDPTTQPPAETTGSGSGFIMPDWMTAALAGLLALAVGGAALAGGDL
jgi:hypothetical protein